MLPYQDTSLSPEARARDLAARLTLREKAGQLNQRLYGFSAYSRQGDGIALTDEFCREVERWGGLGLLYGLLRADPWSKKTAENGLPGPLAARACNLVQRYVIGHSRFGIPVLMTSECPHGHQALGGYLLPVNLAAGATFHPALLKDAMAVCGRQLRESGVHLALISMLDMARDPRWGRSEECYGEDPCLAAAFARAAVEGMQGQGVCAVAKHFCAQGETTGGVNASAARIGERELREIHLPAAEAAVRAGAQGIMAAYNEIDGVPCHANEALLRGVLRDEYGFRGIVMADGCALDRLNDLTGSPVASAALGLKAGVDVGLWDRVYDRLEEAVEAGLVPESLLDEAVERVLALKFRLGLFEHPFVEETEPVGYTASAYPQSLDMARESAVLLKNDGILPLRRIRSLAVIGPAADDLYRQLGDYTPPMEGREAVTILQGLREVLPGVRLEVDAGDDPARAAALAARCDAALLCLGGTSSRFGRVRFDTNGAALTADDMDCGEGVDSASLRLPGDQEALARAVRGACGRLATVVVAGRAYAMDVVAPACDALLYCFYPGPWGGRAIAEIVAGVTPPSGRLPVSVPRSPAQLPVYYNKKAGVSASYREKALAAPAFRFGDGMGYAEAVYSDVSVRVDGRAEDPRVTLSMRVGNPSDTPCHAVPQLYVADCEADVVRRVEELRAFDKLALAPGESRDVVLTLDRGALSVWNRAMRFECQPGRFRLTLRDGFRTIWNGTVSVGAT